METPQKQGFSRDLGLLEASALVVGSMIGSGIFIAPSLMAGYLRNPLLIILLWTVGGIMTLCGALSYAELAAAMPRTGGQYVFLREAFGPMWGFLYGWALLIVLQTGLIAAVAVAFAKYLGVFFPVFSEGTAVFSIGSFSVSPVQAAAICAIMTLTAINTFGVRSGARVQNAFTLLKVLALGLLVFSSLAIYKGNMGNLIAGEFPVVPEGLHMTFLAAMAVAMSKALFAYESWNSVTFVSEEVKNPQVNLPRSLWLGTAAVTGAYILTNIAYIYILPVGKMALAADNRIGAEVAMTVMGPAGLTFIALAILISTIGCDNGLILTGARVYYAMSRDGLFFKSLGKLDPARHTPARSLWLQGIWASGLTLSGSYSDLLTCTTFAALVFNALTVGGLFMLRKKQPGMERPYRVTGYPWVPLFYVLACALFLAYILAGDFLNSAKGLALVALGVPVYFYWKRGAEGLRD